MSFLEGIDEPTFSESSEGGNSSMRKELVMSETTDPPSDERKRAEFRERQRAFGRMLVNRQTLMIGIRIVTLTVRIVEILTHLFGGF